MSSQHPHTGTVHNLLSQDLVVEIPSLCIDGAGRPYSLWLYHGAHRNTDTNTVCFYPLYSREVPLNLLAVCGVFAFLGTKLFCLRIQLIDADAFCGN
ncbi:hypothetical protein BDN71DRAFT_1453291 [Pleurotus eryngii]|uniref:Uncharacterized protein n=1 Tax=Pleurotus eryngii TaxID=5323 RepID=A0A9P5ZMR8_PLEER|nr:hypothetical protein BDN71DRAFT_1456062 [Pleurotus eryngii]KAF9491294.1 hypothetical protein BDN71DRAFT_1453291 [Pleurotus eryngii]